MNRRHLSIAVVALTCLALGVTYAFAPNGTYKGASKTAYKASTSSTFSYDPGKVTITVNAKTVKIVQTFKGFDCKTTFNLTLVKAFLKTGSSTRKFSGSFSDSCDGGSFVNTYSDPKGSLTLKKNSKNKLQINGKVNGVSDGASADVGATYNTTITAAVKQ